MPKILFIITQSEFGGAQKFLFELVSGLNKKKYGISVAAGQGDGELFRKLEAVNVRTIQLNHLKRNPGIFSSVSAINEIFALLKKEQPDTLFLCSTTAGLLGSIAANRLNPKPKVIYRIGGWAFNDPRSQILNQLIFLAEKSSAGFKDKIIVNSEFDRNAAVKKGICPAEKIVRIYNGLDPEKLEFLEKNQARNFLLKDNADNFLVGAVANFYKTKGLIPLIEGIRLLETKYAPLNAKYIIIGDGKQRPELEKLIQKYSLENKVILKGRIPDAYKYLKGFDAFVLPSLKEGFPWIILEVMSAQVPVIATKVGALPEIIESSTQGLLIEPKNPTQIAQSINKLMKNKALAQELTSNAYSRLKDFSLVKMIRETEKLL